MKLTHLLLALVFFGVVVIGCCDDDKRGVPEDTLVDTGSERVEVDDDIDHDTGSDLTLDGDEVDIATQQVELHFEELQIEQWTPAGQERLSIDWDCFASVMLQERGLSERIDAFLKRLEGFVPIDSYVCYSPEYSHPSLDLLRVFVEKLSALKGQQVRWLSSGLPRGEVRTCRVDGRLPRDLLSRRVLFLRRRGIY